MPQPNVLVTECDKSGVIRTRTTADFFASVDATAKKTVHKQEQKHLTVCLVNGQYTREDFATLNFSAIPRKFRFRTRRAAKKFFSNPVMTIGSQKQAVAVFGQPCKVRVI